MDDKFDYIAFVVFDDKTFRYGFNEDTLEILDETPEGAARAFCPRDDPIDVIIIE